MNTFDIILTVVAVVAFLPFILLVIGGTVQIATEMLQEVIDKFKKTDSTDSNKS